MDKILFTGGSSLVITGEWKSGDPFTGFSSISAVVEFKSKAEVGFFNCTVTLIMPRSFEIYAAASDTALWSKGVHVLKLSRRETNFFSNGDPFVEVLDPIQIEVR